MKYLVMECHMGYAVVLDENGKFLKVANLNYIVGQTVYNVVEMNDIKTHKHINKLIISITSIAACICIMILASWQLLFTPYGKVRIQINPDVMISVNRFDYVIGIEAENKDGEMLIKDYSFHWKKIENVLDELADRAIELKYLSDGGTIYIKTQSKHKKWKESTEKQAVAELKRHLNVTVEVKNTEKHSTEKDSIYSSESVTTDTLDTLVVPVQTQPQTQTQTQPQTQPSQSTSTSPDNHYDDEDDDDEDDDDDVIDNYRDDDDIDHGNSYDDDNDDSRHRNDDDDSNENDHDDDDDDDDDDDNEDDDDDNEDDDDDSRHRNDDDDSNENDHDDDDDDNEDDDENDD